MAFLPERYPDPPPMKALYDLPATTAHPPPDDSPALNPGLPEFLQPSRFP